MLPRFASSRLVQPPLTSPATTSHSSQQQEYKAFTAEGIAVFSIGVLLSLVGVAIIATRPQELKMHDATGNDLLEARRREQEEEEEEQEGEREGRGDDKDDDGGEGKNGKSKANEKKTSAHELENGNVKGGDATAAAPHTATMTSPMQTHPNDNIVGVMEADAGGGGVQLLLTRGR